MIYFGSLHVYCKQYGPKSDCSFRCSLIKVHTVCFHDKSCLECTEYMQQMLQADDIFRQKYWQDKGSYIQNDDIPAHNFDLVFTTVTV